MVYILNNINKSFQFPIETQKTKIDYISQIMR